MKLNIKKSLFTITINMTFFLILMFSIQNSNNQEKIKFLSNETIHLPISFIFGTSFIFGSITGSFLSLIFEKNDE